MLFNSYEFLLIFLPITFIVYFILNKLRLIQFAKIWLILTSLFFYSFWNIRYLPLIFISIIFNYCIGTTLNDPDNIKLKVNKKIVLIAGIAFNILLLGYYKYFDFFIKNINIVFSSHLDILKIVLPLGISFFTFTQIAYLVDAYKNTVKEADFINYTLFVTFFPHLIAGPIIHHKEMMPQFANLRSKILNNRNISLALLLISIGLFKKVLLADNLALFVHQGFDIRPHLSFLEAWFVSIAYTFQLYFDFSGYTDMALGIALLFNIQLPQNFNSPYKAVNIQDFWRRWHITLSRFLRDYIYIPLGGNKKGTLQTYNNLLTTFLIGGIWHGAAWTFVIWGALHGIATVLHRIWKTWNISINNNCSIVVTFLFVNFAWIFFRAHNFHDAQKVINGMIGLSGFIIPRTNKLLFKFPEDFQLNWLLILVSIIVIFCLKNSNEIAKKFKPSVRYLILAVILGYIAILNMGKISEFLYFQF